MPSADCLRPPRPHRVAQQWFPFGKALQLVQAERPHVQGGSLHHRQ